MVDRTRELKDARRARRIHVGGNMLISIIGGELLDGIRQREHNVVLAVDVVALNKHRPRVTGVLNDEPSAVAMDWKDQLEEEGCKHCQECEAAAHVKSEHSMNTRAFFRKKKM